MKALAVLALAAVLAGCGGDGKTDPEARATTPPADRLQGTLDGVQLELEVADDPEERSVGLMRRASVPAGTGMVFLYDELVSERYYMYDVPIPLRATFVRAGRVVTSLVMPPCKEVEPEDCPTYGAAGPYDTVVETGAAVLPEPQPGDAFTLSR